MIDTSQNDSDSDSDVNQDDQPRARKPFLEVDERTKYMTPDDAKKGFSEAGKRIAALSAWEKELKDYDVTPSEVRSYLDELIETRQTAAQMAAELQRFREERAQADRERQTQQSNQTRVANEGKLTKEEKEAVDWLKEQMPNLGYISKEDALKQIKELQEAKDASTGRIDKLESFVQQQQMQYRNSLIDDSRGKLSGWMKEDGYTDNEENSLRLMIESSIRDWIDSDPTSRRSQRFYAGGSVKDELVKEGYERAKSALGMIKSTTGGTYQRNKADALKRNGKKLPNQDITQGKSNQVVNRSKKKIDSSGKRDWIGEKHNEAWEKFQSITNRNEEQ